MRGYVAKKAAFHTINTLLLIELREWEQRKTPRDQVVVFMNEAAVGLFREIQVVEMGMLINADAPMRYGDHEVQVVRDGSKKSKAWVGRRVAEIEAEP